MYWILQNDVLEGFNKLTQSYRKENQEFGIQNILISLAINSTWIAKHCWK